MDNLIHNENIKNEDLELVVDDEVELSTDQNFLVIDRDNLINANIENEFTHNHVLEIEFPYLLTEDDLKIALASGPY